jgi:hypothetical protein
MSTRQPFSVLAFVAFAFGLSPSTMAADGKVTVAISSCNTSDGTVSASSGRLQNTSTTSTLTANCGLMVDIGTAFSFSQTEVWAIDLNGSAAVSCTQYSRYQSSSSISTASSSLSYPSTAGTTTTYTSSSPILLSGGSGSGYAWGRSYPIWNYITCTLPVASGTSASSLITIFGEES